MRKLALLIVLLSSAAVQEAFSQSITGHMVVCRGASRTTLSIAAAGGAWSSGDVTRATIDATTGEVTGVAAGTATISYTIPPATVFTAVVTVNSYVMNNIGFSSGTAMRCTGGIPATCTVSPTSGNAWTSSNTSIATVNTGGLVVPSATNTGTTLISYRHAAGNCYVTREVTVSATPTITATNPMCNGTTQTLTATPAGGTWTSSSLSVGTINTTTGVLSAFTGGGTTIRYYATSTCQSTVFLTVGATPVAITGSTSVCLGNTTDLNCATTGGTWSSTNTSVATVSSTTGLVTPVATGTTTISYSNGGGCASTVVVTVSPAVPAISGPSTVCLGQMMTLSNSISGGYWSSSAPSRATITSGTGIVTGIALGTVTMRYAVAGGCAVSKIVTVNPVPALVTGPANVCMTETVSLSHVDGGGTWASSSANATVDLTTGDVTGVTAGSAYITYAVSPGCKTVHPMIVKSVPGATTALSPLCPGAVTTLVNATSGGTWSSSDPSVVTIGSATGEATSVAAGTATISYVLTTSGCSATTIVTVNSLPDPITGPGNVCPGGAITLASTTGGGTWTSSNTGVATIGASTGNLSALLAGTATISYTIGTGCRRTTVVTVDPLPDYITGIMIVCEGATTTLTSASEGGSWTSSNASIATVSSGGVVAGVAPGTATITYTLSTGCLRTATVTVNPLPNAGAITGSSTLCMGTTITLADTVTGGSWSSSNVSVATVNSSGVVSPVALGSVLISYTVINSCGSASATMNVLVSTAPATPAVTGGSSVCEADTLHLTSSASGGSWSTSDAEVATVNSAGVVMGVAGGSAVISYTVTNACGTAIGTVNIAVTPLPDAGSITGTSVVCAGSTISLSCSATGGVWSSADAEIATVDSVGTVAGVATGSVVISYTVSNGCGSAHATINITVGNPAYVSAISGPSAVCTGSDITLSDSVSGGMWSSSDTSIATVSSTGVVHGAAAGVVTVSYSISTVCASAFVIKSINVNSHPTVYDVTGGGDHCGAGVPIGLSNSDTGVLYLLFKGAAVFGAEMGTGAALSFGTYTMTGTYTVFGQAACNSLMNGNAVVTDTGSLPAIAGISLLCQYSSTTLSNSASGGTWSSSNPSVASIGSAGDVSALTAGSATISYAVGSCLVTRGITVNAAPIVFSVTGGGSFCMGGSEPAVGLSASQTGVVYQLYNGSSPFSSPVSGTGSAISFGTFTFAGTFTVSATNVATGCVIGMSGSAVVSLVGTPSAGTISGPTTVAVGAGITLSSTAGGGSWSSSNSAVAAVTGSSGIVTGVSGGSVTISYSVTNACGTAVATHPVFVTSPRPAATADAPNVVTLYPNPTSGVVNIHSSRGGTATLFTLEGREIVRYNIGKGDTRVTLPGTLAAGVYTVRIDEGDGDQQVVRLVYEP